MSMIVSCGTPSPRGRGGGRGPGDERRCLVPGLPGLTGEGEEGASRGGARPFPVTSPSERRAPLTVGGDAVFGRISGVSITVLGRPDALAELDPRTRIGQRHIVA